MCVCVCVCVCVYGSGSARAKTEAERKMMEGYTTKSGSKQVEKIKAVFAGAQGSATTARYDHVGGAN